MWAQHTILRGNTRKSLVTQARKFTKKSGSLQVVPHPGKVVTSKPLGTRMGKGKGKPSGNTRGWLPEGGILVRFRGVNPTPKWNTLTKRTPRNSSVFVTLPNRW